MMLLDCPWLPKPAQDTVALMKATSGDGGLADVAALRAVVQHGWGEAELRSIARKAKKALAAAGIAQSVPDVRSVAKAAGLAPFRLLIVASNTANHLADALAGSALRSGILLDVVVAEYEAPETWLTANAASLAASAPDATLLALDRKALNLKAVTGDAASADAAISQALERLGGIADAFRKTTGTAVIVETLAPDPADPQLSMDAWLPGSPRNLIAEFNARLARYSREMSLLLFDTAALADLAGHAAWHPGRYWFIAKYPFALAVLPLYAHRLAQLLAAMVGKSRRVLVLDCDNTLWGGIIGDDGIGGIALGSGNAKGEAHLAIQRMALHYRERGIVLCVSSKNTDAIAREVFREHPEMLIREDHIALFAINWQDKASNIKAMADTLELGLDSFVFLDDNPAERKQVRDTLPAVAVPELPADPSLWLPVFQAAAYFEQVSFSAEDKKRAEFYQANAKRAVQAQQFGDHDAFLKSLHMRMTVAPFDAVGRARIAQLISKSNQFNLTTRRYSEAEVAALEADPAVETLQIRLDDIFGDNGMISTVICRRAADAWDIDTWIMSCRVLGRSVEQAVLGVIARRAREAGAQTLTGRYAPTAKNGLVKDHYAKLGFGRVSEAAGGETRWSLDLAGYQPREVPIEIIEQRLTAPV